MVAQHYRWDFIGLSTDQKPTPATSEKVVDGSTFYCSDNSKLYVFCKDNWYERKALGSGGGGGGTTYTAGEGITIADDTISVDTTTIQPKLTAGNNVTIANNTISATDTTYSTFTGTDGSSAGTAGLVPAPTTTDIDKFLKGDGTWTSVSGGGSGINVLTSADYNYPENNPNRVALWTLDDGIYYIDTDNVSYARWSEDMSSGHVVIIVQKPTTSNDGCIILFKNGYNYAIENIRTDGTGYVANNLATIVVNSTTSTSGTSALSAAQGKKLNDLITPTSASGAPTTSTIGTLGKIYIDTSTDDAYMCVKVSSGTYTWKQITA